MKRLVLVGISLLALGMLLYREFAAPAEGLVQPLLANSASAARSTARPPPQQDAVAELRQRLSELPADSPSLRAAHERALAEMLGTERRKWWWSLPIDEVYDEIRSAAEQGDPHAAYVLGSRSANCRKALVDQTPARLLAELRRETESNWVKQDDRSLSNMRRQFTEKFETYEACTAIGSQRLSEDLSWLERAGREEVRGAKMAYITTWMAQIGGDRHALIADIEKAAVQRDLVREWLGQSLGAGDEQALARYIDIYSGKGGLYPRDRIKEYAYAYAQNLVQSRRVAGFDALWASGPRRYGTELTAEQWDQVRMQGQEIFKTYYEDRPVWPERKTGP